MYKAEEYSKSTRTILTRRNTVPVPGIYKLEEVQYFTPGGLQYQYLEYINQEEYSTISG